MVVSPSFPRTGGCSACFIACVALVVVSVVSVVSVAAQYVTTCCCVLCAGAWFYPLFVAGMNKVKPFFSMMLTCCVGTP